MKFPWRATNVISVTSSVPLASLVHKRTEKPITRPGAERNASPSKEVVLGKSDLCITVGLHSPATDKWTAMKIERRGRPQAHPSRLLIQLDGRLTSRIFQTSHLAGYGRSRFRRQISDFIKCR